MILNAVNSLVPSAPQVSDEYIPYRKLISDY
jgi:hypothetical protein